MIGLFPMETGFRNGDLVQIETDDVVALARVRENNGGRLHIALEVGEYLPWVDATVRIRAAGQALLHARRARILHAGNATALLEIISPEETAPMGLPRGPMGTLPMIDENW